MKVKFRKFSSQAHVPEKATSGSTCFDVFSAKCVTLEPGSSSIVNEVIRVRIKSTKRTKSTKRIKSKNKKKEIQSIKSQTSNFLPLRHFMHIKMLSFLFLFACLILLYFLCFLRI